MSTAPNLQIGSRQWRDFFANTSGWQNVSLAPSRTRRVFDPVQKPVQPTVVLLSPGEYCGPLHIHGNQPVIIRPSQLGETAKVVIRGPEPDRTSRRVRYVGDDSLGSGGAEDALPLEPAIICTNGAQVFIEGICIHGRVEVCDRASCEFLDCFVQLTPHVAAASAQTDNNNNNDTSSSSKKQHHSKSYYAKYANNNNNNSSTVKQNLPPAVTIETLNKTVAAISVLGGNIWASNVIFDVVVANGIGLLASSYIDTTRTSQIVASKQQREQEDEYMMNEEGLPLIDLFGGSKTLMATGGGGAASNENRNSVIHLQACVVRRSAFGFVFMGGKSFAPRVESNRIINCTHAGVVCGGSSRGSIRSNHIGSCDKFGIVFEGSAAPWLHQNIIEENGICGAVARDTSSPTLVRNTLLANGTCQLFCADVATCRAQANHFSGETINGQIPSAAGVSSFAARSILAAPKGDVYGVCFADNSNGVLENCVIESSDSCVISSTGATVKCLNCSLQPIGEEKQQVQQEEENNNNNNNNNNSDDQQQQQQDQQQSSSATEDQQSQQQQQQQYTQQTTSNAALAKAFVKSTFADLTTDGCVVAGVKFVEVRALEDFPDVEAVVEEIPKHLFPSATGFLKQVSGSQSQNNNNATTNSSRPVSASVHHADHHSSSAAAIRMSLSFTPRRPGTATSNNNNNNSSFSSGGAGGGSSFTRRRQQLSSAHHQLDDNNSFSNNNNEFGSSSYLSVGSPTSPLQQQQQQRPGTAATTTSSSYRRASAHSYAKGSGSSAARLNRIAPPEEKLDYHTLKDKKQLYALQVEVKRLRRALYPPSHGPGSKNPMNTYNNTNNNSSSSSAPGTPRKIGSGDTEADKQHFHNLGYHQWNNDKLRDFYAGKATLAEVRSERKLIPGTDATLGERLHDRWLQHKKDEFYQEIEEEEHRKQEVKGRSLSKDQQRALGVRLHDDIMRRFEEDRKRLEREEKERYRLKPVFMEKNAQRRGGKEGGVKFADDDDDDEAKKKTSRHQEEEDRCVRIGEALKKYEEDKKARMVKLEEKYLIRPSKENQVHAGKVYPRKQIEAYCASLYRSHRDEEYAKKASDPKFFEFAQSQHKKDLEKQEKYLSACRAISPKRSREQIALYSDSLYKGHKDLGAKEKAMAAVAADGEDDDE